MTPSPFHRTSAFPESMLTTPFRHNDRIVVIGERLIDSEMESPGHGFAPQPFEHAPASLH